MWERNREHAAELAGESQRLFAQAGDDRMVALALLHRGRALRGLGQAALAESLMEQCLEVSRREGNTMVVAEALHSLAQHARASGNKESACDLLKESLELQRKLDCRFAIAFAQEELAALDRQLGRYETACARLEEAVRIWREAGIPKNVMECLRVLASIAHEMADMPAAERYQKEAQSLEGTRG
jgi:tetratricopeptide (TPR) repeat protein